MTETKSIKVEELQTEQSEDGFVMPEASYEDVMSSGDKRENQNVSASNLLSTPDPTTLKPAVAGAAGQGVIGQSPNLSMPSVQRLADDSFGQAYHSAASAEKATN